MLIPKASSLDERGYVRGHGHANGRGYARHIRAYAFVCILRPSPPSRSPFDSPVVGWLTTPGRDFVDGSKSGCHYQKRCIRTSLMRRFTQ